MPERYRRGRISQSADTSYQPPEENGGNGKVTFSPPSSRIVEPFAERKYEICGYCRNNLREVCLTGCQPERKYRKLDPIPKERLSIPPPRLPKYEPTIEWSTYEFRAMTYLVLYYLHALLEDK
jgi:hypothetical protein